MPYINIETRLKRTWVERLFSWPWRPWQSHIVTVRREYRATYIAPNAAAMVTQD